MWLPALPHPSRSEMCGQPVSDFWKGGPHQSAMSTPSHTSIALGVCCHQLFYELQCVLLLFSGESWTLSLARIWLSKFCNLPAPSVWNVEMIDFWDGWCWLISHSEVLNFNFRSREYETADWRGLTLVKAVKISGLCGFCFFNEERECTPVNCRDLTQANQVLSEKAMAPHCSPLAWKIPWMEEPGRLQSMGLLKVGHDRATSLSLFAFAHWRRKWQPTPENPRDRGAWWAAVYGITQSRTRLKWLSSSSNQALWSWDL